MFRSVTSISTRPAGKRRSCAPDRLAILSRLWLLSWPIKWHFIALTFAGTETTFWLPGNSLT